jgi:glycosyltransferase involved in cell wall biosynthesis
MRILFVHAQPYPPERYSGADVTTHELCDALGAGGHACAVLAGTPPPPRRPCAAADAPGFGVGYPILRRARPELAAAEARWRFAPELVVIQAGAPAALVEAFLAQGLPTLMWVHDVEFEAWGGVPLPRPGLRWLANSLYTAARLRARFGIEAPVLRPLVRPARYRVESRRTRVLFVNPHPFKGLDVALHLAARRPDVGFDFVESWRAGRGPARRWRAQLSGARNLAWHAALPDVRPLLARARLVLVPSRWEETWGRIVSEAQVSGIPALAARRGGLPESVGEGGLLVDADADLAGWERAFDRLWDDPREYAARSTAALIHAARAEIQPEVVLADFLAHARRHAERPRREAAS